jgi:anti-sigma B factor antagonist
MVAMIAHPHPVDQDIFIIEADDSLNDDVTEHAVNELIQRINQARHRKVIVDCQHLEFLSSFGLSLLLRLRHAIHNAGGEVKISDMSVVLEQVLEMSKVASLFKRYVNVNDARTSFLSRSSSTR